MANITDFIKFDNLKCIINFFEEIGDVEVYYDKLTGYYLASFAKECSEFDTYIKFFELDGRYYIENNSPFITNVKYIFSTRFKNNNIIIGKVKFDKT